MKKVAICLRGCISKIQDNFINNPSQIYNSSKKYINYNAVYNSIKMHIIDFNKDCSFDFFIHSWNTDLEKELIELYKPRAYEFENQLLYESYIKNNSGGNSSQIYRKT